MATCFSVSRAIAVTICGAFCILWYNVLAAEYGSPASDHEIADDDVIVAAPSAGVLRGGRHGVDAQPVAASSHAGVAHSPLRAVIMDLKQEDHPWVRSFRRLTPGLFHPVVHWMSYAAQTMGASARRPTAEEFAGFDIAYFHNFPFQYVEYCSPQAMPRHIVVNHIPLTVEFTQKSTLMNLAAADGLEFVPRMWNLPLTRESELRGLAHVVTKNRGHRGVKLSSVAQAMHMADGLAQTLVEPPLLVDGAKFDVGAYLLLLGTDAGGEGVAAVSLRVLVYDEFSLRFCKSDYPGRGQRRPSSAELLGAPSGALFVDDDFRGFWNLPSLQRNAALGAKRALREALGHERMARIDAGIASNAARVVASALRRQAARIAAFPRGARHFYELVRMDNTVDEELRVFTVEINMSPNMVTPAARAGEAEYDDTTWRGRLMDATLLAVAAWHGGETSKTLPLGADGPRFHEVWSGNAPAAPEAAVDAALNRMWP